MELYDFSPPWGPLEGRGYAAILMPPSLPALGTACWGAFAGSVVHLLENPTIFICGK